MAIELRAAIAVPVGSANNLAMPNGASAGAPGARPERARFLHRRHSDSSEIASGTSLARVVLGLDNAMAGLLSAIHG